MSKIKGKGPRAFTAESRVSSRNRIDSITLSVRFGMAAATLASTFRAAASASMVSSLPTRALVCACGVFTSRTSTWRSAKNRAGPAALEPVDNRFAVEGMTRNYRTGAPWRDVPARFGKWNTIYKRFTRLAEDGTWERMLAEVQKQADRFGAIDWVVSIDSKIARVHQHGAMLPRAKKGSVELQESARGA